MSSVIITANTLDFPGANVTYDVDERAYVVIEDFTKPVTFSNTIIAGGSAGSCGQVLTSTGTGVTWSTVGSGGVFSPAGSNTQIQFNSSGSFGASANLTFNFATSTLSISNGTSTVSINSTSFSGTANNALYVGSIDAANVVSNTYLQSNFQTSAGLAANVLTLTANNANNLNGLPASFYTNATNITTGTLPYAQLGVNVINTTANFVISGLYTFNSNLTINTSAGIIANGSIGSAGQVLASNGSSVFWQTVSASAGGSTTQIQFNDGGVFNGTAGFTFTKSTNNVFVANTLTISGATVNNTNYTGTANNTLFVGTTAASSVVSNTYLQSNFQTSAGLAANVITLTANNTLYVGTTTAANVVSNAQLQANLANYQTTAGLAANVATLTANNSTNLNGLPASFYTNATNLSTGTLPAGRLPQANTSVIGGVILVDSVTDTSTTLYAASANSVKRAYDAAIAANTRAFSAQTAASDAFTNAISRAGVTISDTAPSTPESAKLWWNSNDGNMYIYYNDGTSSQWVSASSTSGGGGSSGSGNYFNVKDYGAKGDGVTDDAASINSAISAINAAGGGVIFFPPGTYILETTVVLKSYVTLHGSGPQITILKGKDSTTHVLMRTEGYTTLQGQNNAAGVGPYMFGIRHMSINGNKQNRASSSDGINIYGYGYDLYDLEIYYCKGIGIYSEWGTSANVPVTYTGKSSGIDYMEASIKKIRAFMNDGTGIQFTGPHDSIISDILCFVNGNHGFYVYDTPTSSAGGTLIDQLHAYYNGTVTATGDSVLIGGYVGLGTVIGESNFGASGAGIRMISGARVAGGTLIAFANQGPGIVMAATQCNLAKIVSYDNAGSGVIVTANDNSLGDVLTYNNNGDGLTTSGTNVYATTINSCRSFNNALSGMTFRGGKWFVNNIYAYNNGINGVVLVNGLDRSIITGVSSENSGTQFVMNTTGAGNIINMSTFSATGQTNYSGTSFRSFTRITADGTSSTPLNATP